MLNTADTPALMILAAWCPWAYLISHNTAVADEELYQLPRRAVTADLQQNSTERQQVSETLSTQASCVHASTYAAALPITAASRAGYQLPWLAAIHVDGPAACCCNMQHLLCSYCGCVAL